MLAVALAVDSTGAVLEELWLRGLLFRVVEDAVGTWLALAISAVLFAGLHIGTPDAPVAMMALVGLAGGLLPSAAYIRTRQLWLPIGIHAGWDLIQSVISGLTFAGHQVPGVVRLQLAGPPR